MHTFSEKVAVGTAPVRIFSFIPRDLHSVIIQAVGAVEVGMGSVAIGDGFPIVAGGAIDFSHRDFSMVIGDDLRLLVSIYAVASVATTVRVFGWRR